MSVIFTDCTAYALPARAGWAARARAACSPYLSSKYRQNSLACFHKKADVLAMIKRAKGVTLAEIMKVTGWQAHTVRGFVSILSSKGGEAIESSKNVSGERTYRIAK